MNYGKKTILLILIASAIRCVVANSIELGNDEVYYRIYASHLQWNYFDHPPMVAWLIRLTTANLFFDSEFFIRLGAIISAAATTWIFFLTGKKIGNEQTGFFAAAIYTATIYGSIIAGTFILPDSPQMVFWSAGLYLLISITHSNNIFASTKKNILLFGIVSGLGMLCKIHTAFLWFGFLLYIILYNRKFLRQPVLYLSGAITILFFLPVIKWNIDNNFITYFYHSNRVNISHGGLDMVSFFTFICGQIFYSNPIIFIFILIAVIAALKNQLPISISQKRLLLLTSLPLIIIATIISLFKTALPHWTGPAYSSLILLLATYFTKRNKYLRIDKKLLPLPVSIATGFLFLIITAGVICINSFPGTLGNKESLKKGEGDFTLDMYGWKEFAVSFDKIYKNNLGLNDKTVILCNKWFPAAHIDYYVARSLQLTVFAEGPIEDIHQYKWINEQNGKLSDSVNLYVIIPSNYYFNIEYFAILKNKKPAGVYNIFQRRNRKEARKFTVYYFKKDKFVLN